MENNNAYKFNIKPMEGLSKLRKISHTDKSLKLFFDTEFTGLQKNTTLISIGIVSIYGDTFYAEFTDYDKSMVNEWIHDNVIKHLCLVGEETPKSDNKNRCYIRGSKQDVRKALLNWLEYLHGMYFHGAIENIQFVSDVSHYDFTLLIDLLGDTAFDIPNYVSPTCHDINQDIATCFDVMDNEAFDINREEIVENLIRNSLTPNDFPKYFYTCFTNLNFIKDNNIKHNALFDAVVIMLIYNYMCYNYMGPIDEESFKDLGLI